jgi:hypothetical protein
MADSTPQKLNPSFFWKVWTGVVGMTVVVQFTSGGGLRFDVGPSSAVGQGFLTWFAIALIIAATVIRWGFLPRAFERRQKAILMAVGLALSGAVEYFSVYAFGPDAHSTKVALSALALLSLIQFAPFFAAERQDG